MDEDLARQNLAMDCIAKPARRIGPLSFLGDAEVLIRLPSLAPKSPVTPSHGGGCTYMSDVVVQPSVVAPHNIYLSPFAKSGPATTLVAAFGHLTAVLTPEPHFRLPPTTDRPTDVTFSKRTVVHQHLLSCPRLITQQQSIFSGRPSLHTSKSNSSAMCLRSTYPQPAHIPSHRQPTIRGGGGSSSIITSCGCGRVPPPQNWLYPRHGGGYYPPLTTHCPTPAAGPRPP